MPNCETELQPKVLPWSVSNKANIAPSMALKTPIITRELLIGSKMTLSLDKGAIAAHVTQPDNIAEDWGLE